MLSPTTTRVTVKTLQRIFATHGLPEVCVSYNGSNFTSAEFEDFNYERQRYIACKDGALSSGVEWAGGAGSCHIQRSDEENG